MESNYITRGCAACVTTAATSDQHQEAGRESVALHTYLCSTLQAGRQPSPPTATLSTFLEKQPAKLSALHSHFKDINIENAIVF